MSLKRIKNQSKSESGIILIKNIPKGFDKTVARKWFEQFGGVKRIIIPTSLRSNNPIGIAFVEMADIKVAEHVIKEIPNYIIFDKNLKLSLLEASSEEIHKIFKHHDKQNKPIDKKKLYMEKVKNLTTIKMKKSDYSHNKPKFLKDKGREVIEKAGINVNFEILRSL